MSIKSLNKLNNRAELWKERAEQAFARGDLKRAERLREKSLEIQVEARRIEDKQNRNPS